MVHGYSLDPHPKANYAMEVFASVVILRVKRDRIPATNVKVVDNLEIALAMSNPDENIYAAKVVGPARSSEGVELYYIIQIF